MSTQNTNTSGIQNVDQLKRIIESRQIVKEPGYKILQVSNVTEDYEDPQSGQIRHIVNFKGMSKYHVQEAKKLARDGKYQEAANQAFSTGQRDGIDFVPQKGERVKVFIDNRTTNNGVTGLFVTEVLPLPIDNTDTVSFDLDVVDEEDGEGQNDEAMLNAEIEAEEKGAEAKQEEANAPTQENLV